MAPCRGFLLVQKCCASWQCAGVCTTLAKAGVTAGLHNASILVPALVMPPQVESAEYSKDAVIIGIEKGSSIHFFSLA